MNPTKFACQCNLEHHKGFVNGDLVVFTSYKNVSSRPALRVWKNRSQKFYPEPAYNNGWYVSNSLDLKDGVFGIFLDYNAPPGDLRACTVLVDGIIGHVTRDHIHHATCEKAKIRNSLYPNPNSL